MQIVIELSEEDYNSIDGCICVYGDAIKNGIVLPKGHGRLIDADAITKDINTLRDAFRIYQQTMDKSSVSIVCMAETIIPATKGE